MFAVGTFVMYGSNGVYTVKEIRNSPIDKTDTRLFYSLEPIQTNYGSRAFVPVDSEQVYLRKVMSREEAEDLMDHLSEAQPLEVPNERERRNTYRAAMGEHSPMSCARIIRTVAVRRKLFAGTSKRLPDTDAEYEREAKRNLIGELSVSLELTPEQVEEDVLNRCGVV